MHLIFYFNSVNVLLKLRLFRVVGLKLIGLKYISPGKGNESLKVKPYILSETAEHKELLDLAARH